jgi:hypothetical protein
VDRYGSERRQHRAESDSMTQSYTNPGGSGNRTSLIAVTTTATVNGSVSALVNGTQANEFWWNNGQSGRELVFSFGGTGFTRCITEAKWYQDLNSIHGDWKWQGSNDALTWTDIGASFTLGNTLQVMTTLAGNTSFWHYYRLLQVSGTTSSSPYLREIEFNIDNGGGVAIVPVAQMTQMALEQWVVPTPPPVQMTQIALEQWASVTGAGFFSARHV